MKGNQEVDGLESPELWFHRRATHYVEAQILFHLNQAGVLGFLRLRGAHTAAQIAEALRLDSRTLATLLDYVFEVDDLLDRDPQDLYSLSEFGRRVVDRFSAGAVDREQLAINMFDVRVGAYGPVWGNLGKLMSGAGRFGDDVRREGRFAENGVFKLATNFWDSLIQQVDELDVGSVVEVGLTTGLLERLGERYPEHRLYGLDRSEAAIERCAASAAARQLDNIQWIHGDYFDPDEWGACVDGGRRGMIFSLHFHELIAAGEDRFVDVLRRLKTTLPGWVVVAFEQAKLPHDDKPSVSETLWLYAQSNVLIHHLIGNGTILGREAWKELGLRAGCREVTDRTCNYLGYRAFAFHLGAGRGGEE